MYVCEGETKQTCCSDIYTLKKERNKEKKEHDFSVFNTHKPTLFVLYYNLAVYSSTSVSLNTSFISLIVSLYL